MASRRRIVRRRAPPRRYRRAVRKPDAYVSVVIVAVQEISRSCVARSLLSLCLATRAILIKSLRPLMTIQRFSLSSIILKVIAYGTSQLKLRHYLTLLSLLILYQSIILPPGIGLVQLLLPPILYYLWTAQSLTMARRLLTAGSCLLFLLTLLSLVIPQVTSGKLNGSLRSLCKRALRLSRTTQRSTTGLKIKSQDRKLLVDNTK